VAEPALVVIIDDSPSLPALEALARAEGAAVLTARDGAEGARIACTQLVDMVITAARPAGMDGFQVMRMVRALEPQRSVPVLLLAEDREQAVTALRLGADDAVTRPWDDQELRGRIARVLRDKHRLDSVVAQSAQLEKLSVTDGLTGIHNHRFFQDRLREEFRRAQRYDDPLALVLIDLDHFKAINDSHGHQVGDLVLREVATSLKRSVRETDILARYGGEEFAVLLPKTHLAGSITVAERIWKDLGALRCGPQGDLRVTASLGVSGYPGRSVISADRLVRTADEALYRAKREGRNKISLYQQASFFADQAVKTG
jgi:diguanylate cyclase (GGDEF)-like protein